MNYYEIKRRAIETNLFNPDLKRNKHFAKKMKRNYEFSPFLFNNNAVGPESFSLTWGQTSKPCVCNYLCHHMEVFFPFHLKNTNYVMFLYNSFNKARLATEGPMSCDAAWFTKQKFDKHPLEFIWDACTKLNFSKQKEVIDHRVASILDFEEVLDLVDTSTQDSIIFNLDLFCSIKFYEASNKKGLLK